MPLTDATLNSMGTNLDGLITHVSLHTADPGLTGTSEVVGGGYARLACALTVDADGDLTLDAPLAFSGPALGAVSHIGLWSAVTAGTFRGGGALAGDTTFNAAGAYTVNTITITGTSA